VLHGRRDRSVPVIRSRCTLGFALIVGLLAGAAAAAPAQEPTLSLSRSPDPVTRNDRVVFSGTIPTRQAGEYVSVMFERCGANFATAIAGATTQEGGVWEASPTVAVGSGVFRARWNNRLSDPVRYRAPARIYFSRQRGRKFRVAVTAEAKLSSQFVALQRLAGGRWVHVRRIKLGIAGSAGYGGAYWAEFVVPRRGLTLRIFVPEGTAAPCYAASASQSVRS
jgi:hypothetical protein